MIKKTGAVLLAATFATGIWAGQAGAQNLDLNELAAALALPIITGGHQDQGPWKIDMDDVIDDHGDAVTLNTVTNGKNTPVLLKIDLIDGDAPNTRATAPMTSWRSKSFECLLTGRETALFLFKNGTGGSSSTSDTSEVYVECSNAWGGNTNKAFYTGAANGIMFVAAADPVSGTVIGQNVLFGDSIVIDTNDGAAYSFGAITFQAGLGENDGDKVYRFDNQEYAKFPAVLATNFLAPSINTNSFNTEGVDAELILFTLDGTTGSSVPRALVGGLVYNDDEMFSDFQYVFDCFSIIALDELDRNTEYRPDSPLGLGTIVGHLELIAQPVASPNDGHDDQYGDGNDSRTRPVHGWIVQEVGDGNEQIVPNDHATVYGTAGTQVGGPIELDDGSDQAYWARPLSQSNTAARPFQDDQDATLDADPRL